MKVVFDRTGRALYFSRSPIPHARQWDDNLLTAEPAAFHQHIGLYAYRRDFLLRVAEIPRTPLERLENLAASRAGVGLFDRRGRGERADDRHRHAGRLSRVRRALAGARSQRPTRNTGKPSRQPKGVAAAEAGRMPPLREIIDGA